jgi:hypothetical protein
MPSIHFVRIIIALALLTASLPATAQSSTITYQGQLRDDGVPITGTVNLRFQLYDALIDGSPIGSPAQFVGWPVEDGLFQVELDFGAAAFDGGERFLEVEVNGAPLSPRQRVTAVPFALRAAETEAGAVGGTEIDSTQVQLRVDGACAPGAYIQAVNEDGTVQCGAEPPGWNLAGNAGTDPASDFIGTTDATALEFRTAGVRSLRLEPSALTFNGLPITANVIAGSRANEVMAGVRGATIAGGGIPTGNSDPTLGGESPNRVTGNYGTVGGGFDNQAGDGDANPATAIMNTVGGGVGNTASGSTSTVGGGRNNTASGAFSTVGGGNSNTASVTYATVGGGINNTASGAFATVGGGSNNCAGGQFSWAGGSSAKVRPGTDSGEADRGCSGVPRAGDIDGDEGTFVWAGDHAGDFISTGPNQFLVRAAGGAVITGNSANGDPLDNRLRVDGTLRLDTPANGGTVDLCWNLLAQISFCASSARYKRDIVDLDLGLATALRLQAVGYRWKGNGAADIGFVAEDVAAIDERLVTRNGDGEVEGVKYDRLTAVLANAVQEIDRRHQRRQQALDHLSRQVRTLTEANASLRAELADVRQRQDHELEGLRAELAMLRELLAPQLAEADAP